MQTHLLAGAKSFHGKGGGLFAFSHGRKGRTLLHALAVLLLGPAAAMANPTGGTVAAGAATIASSGNTLNVTQTSNRAVVNWNSFSVAHGETTNFLQPSSSSAILNRVTGGSLSSIYGTINANGQVFLVNPNGVLIGPGGLVNTQSFVASTRDVDTSQFMGGGALTFSGTGEGSVQNYGTLNALGGDVHLIGATVLNAGTINASQGVAGLAAGNVILLQPAGEERLFVSPATGAARSGYGVSNTGTIAAAAAELKAAGGNVYALAVNNGGTIRSTGTQTINGRVLFVGMSGLAQNTGTIIATNADGKGGTIETSGEKVSLRGTILTGAGGKWTIDPTTVDGSSYDVSTLLGDLQGGGDESITATNDISLADAMSWTGSATLTLQSGGTIEIGAAITAANGGLILNALSNITATAAVNVHTFTLQSGHWVQNTATLPTFSATDFRITGGTFLRVAGGNGTTSPYLLTDVYGLQGVNGFLTSNFTLQNDIDASGTANWNSGAGFIPIASFANNTGYAGTFDGGGHAIIGLTISQPGTTGDAVGLFSQLGDENTGHAGTIQNLGLVNASVSVGDGTGVGDTSDVGVLVGLFTNGTIKNVYATGTLTTGDLINNVGGLVGNITPISGGSPSLQDSYSAVTITAGANANNVGGLVGLNGGLILDSYNTGAVSTGDGGSLIGGIAGNNGTSGIIENGYNTGAVTAASNGFEIGGIAGQSLGTVDSTYSTGAVSGGSGGSDIGGLIGANGGTLTNSYWNTTTSGQSQDAGNNGGTNTSTPFDSSTTLDAAFFTSLGSFTSTWEIASTVNGGLPVFQWDYVPLTVTALDQSVQYGNALDTATTLGTTYSAPGLKTGDTIGSVLSGFGLTESGSNVNAGTSNQIDISGTLDTGRHYIVTLVDGTEDIVARPVTVTVSDRSWTYGGAPSAASSYSITSGSLAPSESISVTYTGGGTSSSDAGTYDDHANVTGIVPSNYAITYNDGTDTVSPAPLTLTVTDRGWSQGDTPPSASFSKTSGTLFNGNTISSLSYTGGGDSSSGAGTYTHGADGVNGNIKASNYAIVYNPGTDTVQASVSDGSGLTSAQEEVYAELLSFLIASASSEGLNFAKMDQVNTSSSYGKTVSYATTTVATSQQATQDYSAMTSAATTFAGSQLGSELVFIAYCDVQSGNVVEEGNSPLGLLGEAAALMTKFNVSKGSY